MFKVTPLTFFLKINTEKPIFSVKQQMQPFKHIFKLIEEFRPIFDNEIKDKVRGETPSLEELLKSGNVSFISKDANKYSFDITAETFTKREAKGSFLCTRTRSESPTF